MTSENDKVNNLFFSKEAEKVVQLKECKRKEVLKLYEHNNNSPYQLMFFTPCLNFRKKNLSFS